MRERKVDQETKESLVDTMLASITGRIVEITLRHDASRVIQYLVQHSSPAQRQKIVAELVTKAVEICKTPYGHFAVLKAITYCTDPVDRKKLLSCLNGHFVAVGSNVVGARTVGNPPFPPNSAQKFTLTLYSIYRKCTSVTSPEIDASIEGGILWA